MKKLLLLFLGLTFSLSIVPIAYATAEEDASKLKEYLDQTPSGIILDVTQVTENPYGPDYGVASIGNKVDLLMWVIRYMLSLVAIISILFIIYGGYLYITAHGDESQMEKGKKLIGGVIAGIIIVLASYTIVATLLNFGASSSPESPPTEQTP